VKHHLPRFSVSMPGAKVNWPFNPIPLREHCLGESHPCSECGADLTRQGGHVHAADVTRPRKRICFGLPDFDR
jgi:hypothetical protein